MGLSLVTAPDVEPVTLEQYKAHAKITWDSEDENLRLYLAAAREFVEDYTHRALISQQWDLTLPDFPIADNGRLRLPLGKTISVDSITYFDTDGNSQTASGYQVDLSSSLGGVIAPAIDGSWPSVQSDRESPVTVTFTAGYASADDVPAALRLAVLFRADDFYTMRGAQDEGPGAHLAKERADPYKLRRYG